MPLKKPLPQQQHTDDYVEEGATADSGEADFQFEVSSSMSAEPNLASLAKANKTFIQIQMERDKRQEKKAAKQEKKLGVLSRQDMQLQMDLEAIRAGQPPRVPAGEPMLQRLEESDNIEHYLSTFERLAEVYNWPRQQWAVRLIPLLTGKALTAVLAMDPAHTKDYYLLKTVILKTYEINRNAHRQKFRAYKTPAKESPQELYARLKHLFCKWVAYDTCTKEDIMEKMVLEQYLKVLFPKVKAWVKRHNPKTAKEAADLVDAYLICHKGPRVNCYAGLLRPTQGKFGVGGGSENCSRLY